VYRLRVALAFALLFLLACGIWWWSATVEPRAERAGLAAQSQASAVARSELEVTPTTRTQRIEASAPDPAARVTAAGPRTLRVRVLSAEEEPLARIAVRAFARSMWQQYGNGGAPLWSGETDADGRAEWIDAEGRMKTVDPPQLALAIDGWTPTPPPLYVEGPRVPEEELVWRAPAFGSVELEVRTPLGTPVSDGRASLIAYASEEERRARDSLAQPSAHLEVEAGKARFERVSLGFPLRAIAQTLVGPSAQVDIEALREPGEVRRAQLQLGADQLVLRLRLLREDGSPITTPEALQKQIEGRSARTTGTASPDAEGNVWIVWKKRVSGPEELRLELSSATEGHWEGRATIDREVGFFDLGDAVLTRGELWLAGIVRASDGTPLPGAELDLGVSGWPAERGRAPSAQRVKSDEAGRFRWTHPAPRDLLGLHVHVRESQRSASAKQRLRAQDFPAGSEDAVVRFEATGAIALRWKSPLDFDPEALGTIAFAQMGNGELASGEGTTPSELGASFEALLPGTYTVRVTPRGAANDPLVTLADLVVKAGQSCADPRLLAVDLGTRHTALRFDLESDLAGVPLAGVLLLRPSHAASEEWQSLLFASGKATAIVPRGRYDARFLVRGARDAELFDLEAGRRVRLAPPLRIALHLRDARSMPAAPVTLHAELTRIEAVERPGFSSTPFDGNGLARVDLPAPGRYRVSWIERRPRGSRTEDTPRAADSQEVAIEDLAGEQRVEIAAPWAK
jgi:hypothetical protein